MLAFLCSTAMAMGLTAGQEPPAALAAAPAAVPTVETTLAGLLQTRILPASDATIVKAFKNAYEDSEFCRRIMDTLVKENPALRIVFVPIFSFVTGEVGFAKSPEEWKVTLRVPVWAYKEKRDVVEPWVASVLYTLYEVTHAQGFDVVLPKLLQVKSDVAARTWVAQAKVRGELAKSNPARYAKMSPDGQLLFKRADFWAGNPIKRRFENEDVVR